IRLYGLNFKYYINLINCYKALGIVNSKKGEYQASTDVYDKIKLGVLYIETGEIRRGLILLDEICIEEPDLLITPAIRQYLKDAIKKLK
ncbi:MAG: hypothetical protein MJ231_08060, partial [bacterium]|nr:hypothetical protein [bacterium]